MIPFENIVTDFGAAGDGVTDDTAAIQRAIDAGGIVRFPAGTYRTGTIYLKSNGGLHLEPGAVILGSTNRADYNADDFCPQNRACPEEFVTGAHLIVALEQENVSITGSGTIDGSGRHWVNDSVLVEGSTDLQPDPSRPAQMIFFCECKNVRVTDVNITNGPYWHLFFHGCEGVFCRGLHISGDHRRWTNDGIDVDCCTDVTISDCVIDVGDDALAIRANGEPLLHRPGICENVTVSNCVLHSSRDNGIRIGVGAGTVERCTLTNLVIDAPYSAGICIACRWSMAAAAATTVRDMAFSNLNIASLRPIDIYTAPAEGDMPNDCGIRNLMFQNLLLTVTGVELFRQILAEFPAVTLGVKLLGTQGCRLSELYFSGVTVQNRSDFSDTLFEIRRADGIVLDGVHVAGKSDAELAGAFAVSDASVRLNGVNI